MDIASKIKNLFDSPEKTLTTVNRVGPPVVNVLLVAAIAWLLASMTILLLPRPEMAMAPPVAAPSSRPAPVASVNVQDIVQRHLFGVAPVKPVAAVDQLQEGEAPPETRLPMTLVGTLASDRQERSLAIIESGNEAKVYSVGDTIQSRVTLDIVRAKEVIIINNGKRETLALPREDGSSIGASRTASRTVSRRRVPARSARPTPIASVTRGAKTLSDLIRPQPVFANGKQRGYRIYPGRQRDQFTALGLKAGDLVTEINGTPLDDPSRGKDIFSSLASASQVSVTIERNGTPTQLVLDTSQLDLSGSR